MKGIMLLVMLGLALLCTGKVQHALSTLATDLHNAGIIVEGNLNAVSER